MKKLGKYFVEPFKNVRTENTFKNQVIMYIDNDSSKEHLRIFQSYTSIICIIDMDNYTIWVSDKWNFSITTAKYFYQFLFKFLNIHVTKKDVESALERGYIESGNLKTYEFFIYENLK